MSNYINKNKTSIPKPPVGMGLFSHLSYWLAIGLGSGLSPKAPGTVGSLAAFIFLPLFYLLPIIWVVIVLIVASIFGVVICKKASDDMGVHDSGHIVWDEWVGQWIACLPLIYFANTSILYLILSFALFRFFDILKPFPIGYADKNCDGGLGIMLDDLIAGGMAAIILYVLITMS